MKLKDIKKDTTPLIETPQQIASQQFGLDDRRNNILYGTKFMQNNKKRAIESIGEYTLWEFPRHYMLIRNDDNHIAYYMQYEVKSLEYLNNRPCATQVVVWRDYNVYETQGISAKIFFKCLLYTWGTVMTDTYQTMDGEKFWRIRLVDAFQENIPVYFLDLNSNKNIIRVNNEHELRSITDIHKIWGRDSSYKNKLLLITTMEIR